MDDERRFRWVERAFFQRRELTQNEWWLGLAVLGMLVVGFVWIVWPLLPTILSNIGAGIAGLFASPPPPAPVVEPTPIPTPSPSPSPSPAASAG